MVHLNSKRVVVAMSGGVDSSVAAILLREQGYEVIGMSMKTHEAPDSSDRARHLELPSLKHASKTCCSVEDIMDARAVCRRLGIPFYAVNFKNEFKQQVMDYFAEEYHAGRTPNPCVKCNDQLKFKALLCQAKGLGARYLATGHYVRKIRDEHGIYHIYRASDTQKDQSYFLFGLKQQQLKHILFPIGDLSKDQVRSLARKAGIITAEKPESQEICFVTDNDYNHFLDTVYSDKKGPPGLFCLQNGTIIGKHNGIHGYTIGQRRGLGLATGERLYVVAIDRDSNEITLGRQEELYQSRVQAQRLSWITGTPREREIEVHVKIRYRHEPMPARLTINGHNEGIAKFYTPQRAVTPGQAMVFYRGTELLGGGWIKMALQ